MGRLSEAVAKRDHVNHLLKKMRWTIDDLAQAARDNPVPEDIKDVDDMTMKLVFGVNECEIRGPLKVDFMRAYILMTQGFKKTILTHELELRALEEEIDKLIKEQ